MTAYAWCPTCGKPFTWDGELPCPNLAYLVARHLRQSREGSLP